MGKHGGKKQQKNPSSSRSSRRFAHNGDDDSLPSSAYDLPSQADEEDAEDEIEEEEEEAAEAIGITLAKFDLYQKSVQVSSHPTPNKLDSWSVSWFILI